MANDGQPQRADRAGPAVRGIEASDAQQTCGGPQGSAANARPVGDADQQPVGGTDQQGRYTDIYPADAEVVAAHDPLGFAVADQVNNWLTGILPEPRTGPRHSKARQPPRRRPGTFDEQRSGAGPDPRDPQPVGKVLGRLYDSKGWSTEVSLRAILARWHELVGQVNAEHSHPESYADGLLVVRAESSTWASALRTIAAQLVAQLNSQLGDGAVRRIEVKGPSAPSWKHGPRSVRDGRGPRDTYG